jgi:two-component system NtrC family sensor kinase
VGQVAAGIAHEINNPMSVILNHVQLLQSHSLTEEESDVFMSRISSEIKRVAGLIERLLQFSREEQDAEETAFPGEVLQDVLCLFAPQQEELDDTGTPCTVEENAYNAGRWTVQHKKRTIHVCLTDSGTIYPVSCGKDSIKQIFFNIFKNALEAINHDFGMIHVHIQYSREETVIRISDNGKGLPDGSGVKIFDPFYSQKRGSGTGLGLSLCQTIMERVGGSITAHGNNNRGTVVNLVFPGVEE